MVLSTQIRLHHAFNNYDLSQKIDVILMKSVFLQGEWSSLMLVWRQAKNPNESLSLADSWTWLNNHNSFAVKAAEMSW